MRSGEIMRFAATFHDLAGKSVFISGGGSGIGEYLTEGFVAQGADVAFVQRSDATALCDRLEKAYGAIAQAAAAHGDIGVLVNNAAWDNRHALEGFSVDDWDHMQAVNLRHHFFAIQSVAPGMRKAGRGTIINYSSISYMMGAEGFAAYVTAKAGITGLTRGLARELGPDNIRVNALMPGWVLTERQRKLWADEASLKAHIDMQCLKIEIPPEAMVEPTLFLASAASSVMTGQALVVDGGVVVSG
jgi:NAD(P)-dependent dehydrogenase (short-subunit alcohol dehydrogenase family)